MKTRHSSLARLLLAALLWGAVADAYYVIAYDIQDGSPADRALTAVVVLPDYYRRSFSTPGALQELLTEAHHAQDNAFVQVVLDKFYDLYLEDVVGHPEIYGTDAGKLVAAAKRDEPLNDDLSAVTLLFARGDLSQPLGMVRFSSEDAKGRVPAERHYWGKGIEQRIERDAVDRRWLKVPVMEAQSFLQGRYPFVAPFRSQLVNGVSGAMCEAKSYWLARGSDLANQARLYAVARQHAMPWVSSHPWPSQFDSRGNRAMLHSQILVHAYGPIMNRFWEDVVPGHQFILQNEWTRNLKLYFKVTTVDNFDEKLLARHSRKFESFIGNSHARLVYNRALTQTLRQTVSCPMAMELTL